MSGTASESLTHVHHIVPKHRGGNDDASNLIRVQISQCDKTTQCHAMWHFCEWQLHGLKEDYLAWKGLAGFFNKEELIFEVMERGREKGRKASLDTQKKMLEDGIHPFQLYKEKANKSVKDLLLKKAKEGTHQFQDPEFRKRRAQADKEKQQMLWSKGRHAFQREEVRKKMKESSSKSRSSQNSRVVECPHCGKSGGYTNMKRYHFDKCKELESKLAG